MSPTPSVQIREWSTITPDSPVVGSVLRGAFLSAADRELLAELEGRASLRITELRTGLAISVGPHIGNYGELR